MSPRKIIRCGTSGWSYPDWDSVIYPTVKPRGFHPLEHLAKNLDAVEIESSFHQALRPELVSLWIRKTECNPNFQFSALLGRQFTFDRNLDADAVAEFKNGLWPLLNAGKMGCVLMRFPWSFRFTKENREFLIETRRTFHEFPLVAEMRHSSWMLDEALGTLMDYRVGFCNVDQSEGIRAMQPSAIVTSPVGYTRLTGRGGDWTSEDGSPAYLYSPQELGGWQARMERVGAHTSRSFVILANHLGGRAAINALQLKSMLGASVLETVSSLPQHRTIGAGRRPAPSMPPKRENVVAITRAMRA
jgi:uncharacterized protein YecE (DUF72 family)